MAKGKAAAEIAAIADKVEDAATELAKDVTEIAGDVVAAAADLAANFDPLELVVEALKEIANTHKYGAKLKYIAEQIGAIAWK